MNARDSNICPFILKHAQAAIKNINAKKRGRFFLWRFEAVAQGWTINFPKGPHEKLGRLQRAMGHVYGERGGVFLPG